MEKRLNGTRKQSKRDRMRDAFLAVSPAADVDNAGSIWFRPAPGNRGTIVKISLKYAPASRENRCKTTRNYFGKGPRSNHGRGFVPVQKPD